MVFTGDLAQAVGDVIGLGSTAVTVWNIAKWPVLVILVSLMFAILYWASPNAKHGGFRWVSPGGVLRGAALDRRVGGVRLLPGATSANYNKTYGTLAGVIAFLVWLWISNIAILLGAEMDAELERGRAIAAGHAARRRAVPGAARRPQGSRRAATRDSAGPDASSPGHGRGMPTRAAPVRSGAGVRPEWSRGQAFA